MARDVRAPERAFGVVAVSLYIPCREDERRSTGTCVPVYPLGVAMKIRSFTAKTIFGLILAVVMVAAFATAGSASPRSGDLHVTKECSQNHFNPGDFCTITGSNLSAISPGMKVIYIDAPGPFGNGDFGYDTDIVLDGPGNNDAYGHVVLSFLSGPPGTINFSGGTGRFQGFHASVYVTLSDTWHWDGTYYFTPPGHDK